MGIEKPYVEELGDAINRAKKAILEKDYDQAAAWQRQIEVLAPLASAVTPTSSGTGPAPLSGNTIPVIEVPGEAGVMTEGQRRRAEARALPFWTWIQSSTCQ